MWSVLKYVSYFLQIRGGEGRYHIYTISGTWMLSSQLCKVNLKPGMMLLLLRISHYGCRPENLSCQLLNEWPST